MSKSPFRRLRIASMTGDLRLFKRLNKTNNANGAHNFELLNLSIEYGHLKILQYIIENSDIKVSDIENSAISSAVYKKHLDILKYLISLDTDVNRPIFNDIGIEACSYGRLSILKYLVSQGFDVCMQHEKPMMVAAPRGKSDIVKYLLEQGADIHGRDSSDFHLLEAVKNGHLDVVKVLVEAGADYTIINNLPLKTAKRNGYINIVEYLERKAVEDNGL